MAWFDIAGGLAKGLGEASQIGLAEVRRRQQEEEALDKVVDIKE